MHRVTVYQQNKKEEMQDSHDIQEKPCKFCGCIDHGESPSRSVREQKCPAWNKECNKCHAKGHFKSKCCLDGAKLNAVNVLEKKDTVYLAGMTGVSMKKGRLDRAEQSIFWTSITTDITRTGAMCRTCVRNSPSQPGGKPVRPSSPSYPFQLVVG